MPRPQNTWPLEISWLRPCTSLYHGLYHDTAGITGLYHGLYYDIIAGLYLYTHRPDFEEGKIGDSSQTSPPSSWPQLHCVWKTRLPLGKVLTTFVKYWPSKLSLNKLFFTSHRFAQHEHINKMSPNNLAIIFAPCLLQSKEKKNPEEILRDLQKQTE
jgi:hypothetical protein